MNGIFVIDTSNTTALVSGSILIKFKLELFAKILYKFCFT